MFRARRATCHSAHIRYCTITRKYVGGGKHPNASVMKNYYYVFLTNCEQTVEGQSDGKNRLHPSQDLHRHLSLLYSSDQLTCVSLL